jgi:hypothetical protein
MHAPAATALTIFTGGAFFFPPNLPLGGISVMLSRAGSVSKVIVVLPPCYCFAAKTAVVPFPPQGTHLIRKKHESRVA